MLLGNLTRIIDDNYSSLVSEAWGTGWYSRLFVAILFGLVPISIGIILGYLSPVWTSFVGAIISVIGVLTGFSINSLVLLTGHSEENSYPLKTKVVNQTKDFTLYSILVGIVLLIVLLLGFSASAIEHLPTMNQSILPPVSSLQFISIIVYTLIAHYLLVLLVIAHRLYTLVHGNALGNLE